MHGLIKKLNSIPVGVKSAFVYTVSSVVTRGLAVITVPIFTRLMTTEQIGTVGLYNSWYAMISAFATLSLTSGGFTMAMKAYPERRDKYESSVLSLTTIIALLIAGVYCICPSVWQNILGIPNGLIVLMLFGFLFAPARDFWMARQRYEYKYKLSGFVSILTAIMASVLSVLVVIYMNQKGMTNVAEGRLYANYFVIYGVSAIIWLYIMCKGRTLFNKEFWKMSLALSLPLVGFNIAGHILNVSDRLMISKMVNDSAVGIYGVLYTVSSLSLLVWQAINSSFVPYLFQNIEKKGNKIKDIANLLMIMYAVISIMITYFAPEIVRILATDEYYEAIYIMPPIAAGVFLTAFSNIYSNIAVYYKKTKYVMYPAFIAAGVNLLLNYIFIKLFGYMAAAYTTLVSFAVQAFLQALWSSKVCKQNGADIDTIFDSKKMFGIALFTIISCIIGIPLYQSTLLRYCVILIAAVFAVILCKKGLASGVLGKKHGEQ